MPAGVVCGGGAHNQLMMPVHSSSTVGAASDSGGGSVREGADCLGETKRPACPLATVVSVGRGICILSSDRCRNTRRNIACWLTFSPESVAFFVLCLHDRRCAITCLIKCDTGSEGLSVLEWSVTNSDKAKRVPSQVRSNQINNG